MRRERTRAGLDPEAKVNEMTEDRDVIVIGGGLVGSAIAFGLARLGKRVTVLDEGDVAMRASRANFGLVWIQSKGLGLPDYTAWTKSAVEAWPDFAAALREISGLDVAYERPGGFLIALSDQEMQTRIDVMSKVCAQPGAPRLDYDIFDHDRTKAMLPALGPEVVGSIYCPLDGHVNSLRLFRALHASMKVLGVAYRSEHAVDRIVTERRGFRVSGKWGEIAAEKVVIAAGLSNQRLAAMAGIHAPVVPSKGQIIVTEKAARFLEYPTGTIRQTDEGSVMLGDSQESVGFDMTMSAPVNAVMAQRAVRTFPCIGSLNVVRMWTGLRVMSPDGFPIYQQSATHPGAFVVTCHSGVTLAPSHATTLADYIAGGALPSAISAFSSERFDVSSAA